MEETSGSNSLSYTVNLDISEAKKNAEELAKAYANLQVQATGIVVTIDVDSALEQVKSLTEQLKELQGVLESNKDSTSAYKSVLSDLSDGFNTVTKVVEDYDTAMKTIDEVIKGISDLYTDFLTILTSITTAQDIATLSAGDAVLAQELLSEGLMTAAEAEEAFVIALEASAAATEAVTTGMELFRVALASTGVGVLLVGLGSLVAYFTQTQEGIDEVSSALEPLKIGFNLLTNAAISFGKGIANIFSAEGLKNFGQILENQVINRFKALGVIMDGLIHLDLAKVLDGVAQSVTGVVDPIGKVKAGVSDILSTSSDVSALRKQQGIQASTQDSNLQAQETIVTQSKKTASDSTKDRATREAAVQAGLAAIKEELRLKNSLLELNKKIADAESAGKPTTNASTRAALANADQKKKNTEKANSDSEALEATLKVPKVAKVRKTSTVSQVESDTPDKPDKADLQDAADLSKKLQEYRDDAVKSQQNQDSAEVKSVNDKYLKLNQSINDFYDKAEQDKSGKTLTLDNTPVTRKEALDSSDASKKTDLDTISANVEIEKDKKTYAAKKALFDEYNAYKLKVGEKTADEAFGEDITKYKTYQAYLDDQVPDDDDHTILGNKQRDLLNNTTIPAADNDQSKDDSKELQQALADTESINEKRLVLQQKYQDQVKILEDNGDTENAAQAKKNGDAALKAFDVANGKLNVSDEFQKTSDAFKSLADSTKGLDGGLSNVFKALSGITGATAATIKGIDGVNSGFKNFNATSTDAGGGLKGDIAGGLAIAGPASAAVSAVLGVTKSVIGFFKASKQSAIDSAKALQTYQNSLVLGQVSYNELLRSQALTAASVTDATLAQLDAKEKLLVAQKSSNAADEATLLAQIQSQGQQVTGEHTVKSGGFLGVGKKTSVVQDTSGVSTADYDTLLKLYTEGKLTDTTKTWFEALQKVHDESTSIATETQATQDAINQSVTGTTASSISDSIIQGFKDGKRSATDFAGDFKTLMSNAMYSAIESNYLTPAIDAFYKKFADASKDGLTADEEASLKDEYNGIIANASAQSAEVDKITGGTAPTTAVSGTIVGQAITEDTANRALGIWIGQYDTVKSMSGTIGDMYVLATQNFSTTIAIAENTLRTANNTDGIGDKLDKIVSNTSPVATTSIDQTLRNAGIKA
ncbi:hypothetical protein [Pedobacter sp. L105]|uniref:hypothetical protein n=1 Tax=Pedobacter sp. L105 TaxID=1641871 RepID=UPI00131D83FD|nr:hypothetical protein [Pedobacter sp. L105]